MSEGSDNNMVQPAGGDRLAQLWRRVMEHRIAQWTLGYVAVAYGIQHGVTLTAEALDWPHVVERATMIALILGVPLAVTFAWYRGNSANRRISAGELSIVSVLLVIGAFLFYTFARPAEEAAVKPKVQEASVTTARRAAADPRSTISLAVLPFVNLSSDKEQEFFSDGMTEEITAALAKVPDLRVVSRTSAFEFKGKNVNLKTMADQLGATHLIEGSVRKVGNRVRITAQLIRADDDSHIWAEDYDRELTDVFAIQEDIARAITTSLRMPLGLRPGENLVNNRDIDPESYQQFLRARALTLVGGFERKTDATALLEQIVARHPNYAPAWALLARVYLDLPGNTPQRNGSAEEFRRVVDEYFSKSDAAGQRAIQLDPNMPEIYDVLASRYRVVGKPLEADAYASRAIALDPDKDSRAQILDLVGRVKETLVVRQKLQKIEPLILGRKYSLMGALWVNGQNEAAIALEKTLPPPDDATRAGLRAVIYASMGRYGEAIDRLAALPSDLQADAAIRLLRTAPAKTDIPKNLPALADSYAWVYLYVGGENRVLDNYESRLDGGDLTGTEMAWLWHPSYAPVRKTERFKSYARKAGFVEYWRAKGWPEFCHPTTGEDFECK